MEDKGKHIPMQNANQHIQEGGVGKPLTGAEPDGRAFDGEQGIRNLKVLSHKLLTNYKGKMVTSSGKTWQVWS